MCDELSDEFKEVSTSEENYLKVKMKKSLGLCSGISIIVGTIIGSGIWITPGTIMNYSESVGIFLIQWAVSGVLATLGGLCYIELAYLVPKSGGETVYLKEAFGDFVSFIYSWLRAVVLSPTNCAILAEVSAKYILLTHPSIKTYFDRTEIGFIWTYKTVGLSLLMFSLVVNASSSKGAVLIQIIVTASQMLGVAIVIIGGLVRLSQNHTEHFQDAFTKLPFLDTFKPASIGLIAFNGLWTYDGWNQLNFVTEEIQNPKRNLAASIAISLPIIVIVYILMNVSYLTALSPQKLANSTVVGVDWADEVLGSSWSWIIPICVSICAFGTLHASLFANGRQAYAASREGHLPEVISYVNKYTLTPTPGLLFTGSLGIIFILMKDIDALLNMFMVAMTFFYGLSMLALIVLKYKRKDNRYFPICYLVPGFLMLCFWYCSLSPLFEVDENSKTLVKNINMYTWNGICLFPGLVLYLLRCVWRLYWSRKYGIEDKPVPGSDLFTEMLMFLFCVVKEHDN